MGGSVVCFEASAVLQDAGAKLSYESRVVGAKNAISGEKGHAWLEFVDTDGTIKVLDIIRIGNIPVDRSSAYFTYYNDLNLDERMVGIYSNPSNPRVNPPTALDVPTPNGWNVNQKVIDKLQGKPIPGSGEKYFLSHDEALDVADAFQKQGGFDGPNVRQLPDTGEEAYVYVFKYQGQTYVIKTSKTFTPNFDYQASTLIGEQSDQISGVIHPANSVPLINQNNETISIQKYITGRPPTDEEVDLILSQAEENGLLIGDNFILPDAQKLSVKNNFIVDADGDIIHIDPSASRTIDPPDPDLPTTPRGGGPDGPDGGNPPPPPAPAPNWFERNILAWFPALRNSSPPAPRATSVDLSQSGIPNQRFTVGQNTHYPLIIDIKNDAELIKFFEDSQLFMSSVGKENDWDTVTSLTEFVNNKFPEYNATPKTLNEINAIIAQQEKLYANSPEGVLLGQFISLKCATCREQTTLLHLSLAANNIDNKIILLRWTANSEKVAGQIDGHAVVAYINPQDNHVWFADPVSGFNLPEADALLKYNARGLSEKSPRGEITIAKPSNPTNPKITNLPLTVPKSSFWSDNPVANRTFSLLAGILIGFSTVTAGVLVYINNFFNRADVPSSNPPAGQIETVTPQLPTFTVTPTNTAWPPTIPQRLRFILVKLRLAMPLTKSFKW